MRIGVLAGAGSREEIARQLDSLGAPEWHERPEPLVARAGEGALDVAVAGLRDGSGCAVAPVLVELAARRPTMPVVVHARVDRAAVPALIATLAPGMRVECAVRPFARLAPLLRHLTSASYRPGVAPLLLHHFVPHAPASLLVFVALAAIAAPARRAVEELGMWARLSPRSIERHLRAARWPHARVVLRSFAALDAAWMMTEYGWSAKRVQKVRGFAHASGVTRLLSAYAGTRPSTIAEDGGFQAALERVTRALVPGAER